MRTLPTAIGQINPALIAYETARAADDMASGERIRLLTLLACAVERGPVLSQRAYMAVESTAHGQQG